jgi:hypothetical protein
MLKRLIDKEDYFKSSDIALCASLRCFNYNIEEIDKQNPSKAIFIIKRDRNLDNLVRLYFAHQLTVEPWAYFNFLKEIKTRLYNV